MNMIRKYLHVLIIFAIASAGISPACAFISGGQTQIEICAADGTLKTITVAQDQAPPSGAHHETKQNKDCAFCFNTAHSQGLALNVSSYPALMNGYLPLTAGSALPIGFSVKHVHATGPPALS